MISLRSGASISATVLLHVILAFLFMLGLMEHTITPPEAPPVLVELMQSQPTPKTIEQPVAKPIPVPPRPQPVAAPAPTPQPQPIPSKVSTPTEVAQATPVAPVSAPTAPTPPAPTRVEAPPAPPSPAPVVTAPSKTDVSIPASYSASNQKPIYPNMSKRLGEQGTVVLRVLVKADGSAGEVEVKSSSNYPRLDQAAIDAVKTWRFNPAKIDGKATDEWYQVPIPFKLQSSSN
jgi:periplasmic protein TonB